MTEKNNLPTPHTRRNDETIFTEFLTWAKNVSLFMFVDCLFFHAILDDLL